MSLDWYGRECVLVTPRSAQGRATHLLLIDDPRSACSVSVPGSMLCFLQVSSMSLAASVWLFLHRDHSADDIAAVHVNPHLEVRVGPLLRAAQLGMSQLTARSAATRRARVSQHRRNAGRSRARRSRPPRRGSGASCGPSRAWPLGAEWRGAHLSGGRSTKRGSCRSASTSLRSRCDSARPPDRRRAGWLHRDVDERR